MNTHFHYVLHVKDQNGTKQKKMKFPLYITLPHLPLSSTAINSFVYIPISSFTYKVICMYRYLPCAFLNITIYFNHVKIYSSVIVSIFTQLCKYHIYLSIYLSSFSSSILPSVLSVVVFCHFFKKEIIPGNPCIYHPDPIPIYPSPTISQNLVLIFPWKFLPHCSIFCVILTTRSTS